MTSLISYNFHSTLTYGRGYSADEKRRFWEHFERLAPESMLVLDDFDVAKEAKRRRPECRVVFREYRVRDGKFFQDMTPEQFYNGHAKFGDAGLIVSVLNEPTGYGGQNTPEDLEKIAAWMAKVMKLHGQAGHSIVGPEFGVGHPDLNRLSELDEMWEAFKEWTQDYYGCHEYGTYRGMMYVDETHQRDVFPHRVGRYKSILSYVRQKFDYELPVLINEWGIDSSFYAGDDTRKRGWRDAGITDAQYADMLIQCANEVYTEPNVKGLNIFSHGNTGKQFSESDWKTHDVSFQDAFQKSLEAYSAQRKPPVLYPSLPNPLDARWKLYSLTGDHNYYIRHIPSIKGAEIAKIRAGELFSYIPDSDYENDGIVWIQVKNSAGNIGWSSKDVLTVEPSPDPEQPPAPEPPKPPPVNDNLKEAALKQIEAVQASIKTLEKYAVKLDEEITEIENELSDRRHFRAALDSSIELQRYTIEFLESLVVAA